MSTTVREPKPYIHRKKHITELGFHYSLFSPCKQAKVVNIRPLSLSFLSADMLWANHNVQVLAVTQSRQRQLSAPVNRQAGCSKVPAPTNLRCMSSWQQNNYFLRGSYCLRHAMNSVQVQCQFITLHYLRQLTSWVQLLKKREIISALTHLIPSLPQISAAKGKSFEQSEIVEYLSIKASHLSSQPL